MAGVLRSYVAEDVVIRHADDRRLHAARIGARSEERRIPVEIQEQRVGDVLPAAALRAMSNTRIASVLHVEDARAERIDQFSLGVHAHPTRGAKFNLSSSRGGRPIGHRGHLDVGREPDR